MQWTNVPNAGFCPPDVDPWLPVNPNYIHGINVADQLKDPDSLLTFYQRILWLRRQTPALIAGEYTPLHQDSKDYLAFLRYSQVDDQICLVVLNMSEQTHRLSLDLPYSSAHVLFSSHNRDSDTDNVDMLSMAPFETYIAELRWGTATSKRVQVEGSAKIASPEFTEQAHLKAGDRLGE